MIKPSDQRRHRGNDRLKSAASGGGGKELKRVTMDKRDDKWNSNTAT